MGLMPQVRIRNTTSEYKLAAKLFTPSLFEIEERGPLSRKQTVFYDSNQEMNQTNNLNPEDSFE